MSSAIAFTSEGALSDEFVDVGVVDLFDALDSPEFALPCRSVDADLWFAEAPSELERAKGFCAECPVRAACLAGALARHEPWGVWGGEIFERGAVVARKRPRGRPRKNPVVEPSVVSRPGVDGRTAVNGQSAAA